MAARGPKPKRRGIPYLGEIPLDMQIRQTSDDGRPIVAIEPDGVHAKTLYRHGARDLDHDRHRRGAPAAAAHRHRVERRCPLTRLLETAECRGEIGAEDIGQITSLLHENGRKAQAARSQHRCAGSRPSSPQGRRADRAPKHRDRAPPRARRARTRGWFSRPHPSPLCSRHPRCPSATECSDWRRGRGPAPRSCAYPHTYG